MFYKPDASDTFTMHLILILTEGSNCVTSFGIVWLLVAWSLGDVKKAYYFPKNLPRSVYKCCLIKNVQEWHSELSIDMNDFKELAKSKSRVHGKGEWKR